MPQSIHTESELEKRHLPRLMDPFWVDLDCRLPRWMLSPEAEDFLEERHGQWGYLNKEYNSLLRLPIRC